MNNHVCHKESAIDTSIREFYEHLTSLKYSPATIGSYRNALKKFHSFLTAHQIERLQDVTIQDLDQFRLFLVDQGFARKSLHTYQCNIRQFFNHLEQTHQLFMNPAEYWEVVKLKPRLQHVPSVKDMKKLLVQPDISTPSGIRDRALLETMYSTGARLEEVVRINLFDVNLKQGSIRVLGKGNKERMVPLGKQAVSWLDRYIKEVRPRFIRHNVDEHALFLGTLFGRRLNPQIVGRLVRDYSKKAGITPVSPQAIRRACATHMLKGGAHPVQIQMLLGHATMSTLSKYLKVTITDMLKMYKKGKPGK